MGWWLGPTAPSFLKYRSSKQLHTPQGTSFVPSAMHPHVWRWSAEWLSSKLMTDKHSQTSIITVSWPYMFQPVHEHTNTLPQRIGKGKNIATIFIFIQMPSCYKRYLWCVLRIQNVCSANLKGGIHCPNKHQHPPAECKPKLANPDSTCLPSKNVIRYSLNHQQVWPDGQMFVGEGWHFVGAVFKHL